MSADIVVLRVRNQIPRQPRSASAPARIEGNASVGKLVRGLATEGLVLQQDRRTGDLVIRRQEQRP